MSEPLRVDLHAHSKISDGTETPRDLIAAARAANLDVVALTDHDTVAGWGEAATAAVDYGVTLIRGLELSCARGGAGIHVLGYLIDPLAPGVDAELTAIRAGRADRLPAMLAALARHGMPLTQQQVWAQAGAADSLGRPHVADAMVAAGYVADRRQAFDEWLGEGRPAFVNRYAPDVADGVTLIKRAGGIPVLAHPWGRQSRRVVTVDLIGELAELGLAGLEAHHADHDEATEAELVALAGDLGLAATGGSDWHGRGKVGHDLGSRLTSPPAYRQLFAGRTQV
jgi:predicted metal-dependent phosphoesterase TrpH